ncbi:alpha/beta fold hydrolase [Variovorax sp. YR216]|uniref:alpha/beta fold hydrolase n=1 Tax=Variovorax sp. YR216 TaxID=1882828 RepID=UPI00089B04D9|nr:alpha/beta hydrolase [Variovorax sp. YR216]SEB20018.1 Pimeloyl-ACP methyl ester carboxylesterase [Variovorax sp. YR216]
MTPVLLLIPGMLNDAAVWHGVVEAMGPQVQVRTAAPVQPSIAEMAQAAWALLADVPAQQPVVLAGFSLGGYVAIEMLARPARPLRAALLLSTSARPETPEGAATREKSIAAMQRDFAKVVDGIVQWSTVLPSPERVRELTDMMLRVGADTAMRQLRAIAARGDHRAPLSRLDLPVTVLCGREDRTTPAALSEEIAALVPGARCEIVDGASHMLPVEQPQAVARALREWLH